MKIFASLALSLAIVSAPTFAQELSRPQDGFYSGQSGSQSNGQVSDRVDGR